VKYFAYADTVQETCLRLMGRKLLVALAMEGKFSTEGLQAVGEDDDLLMAMARELVTEKGIGENAELVWRSIQQQNEAFTHVTPAQMDAEPQAHRKTLSFHTSCYLQSSISCSCLALRSRLPQPASVAHAAQRLPTCQLTSSWACFELWN